MNRRNFSLSVMAIFILPTSLFVRARPNSELVLKNVSFGYPEREKIFSGLDLTIEAGKTIGIVGSTGSGKTTLVRLMLRFADIDNGSISWVGKDIREWKLKSLRSSIALVDQHITLFPTTILENIRYGNPDSTDEEVKQSAIIAEANEYHSHNTHRLTQDELTNLLLSLPEIQDYLKDV